jgi:Tfp pilus assembly protein PilO
MRENLVKIITLFLIVVLGLVTYRTVIVPKASGVRKMRDTLRKIELQVNTIFGEEVTLRGGMEQHEELLKQLEKFSQQIPSENNLPGIVDEIINRSGEGLKIDYTLVEPQELQSEGKYKRLPIKISFVCNYPDFITYLTQLQDLAIITSVDNLEVKRDAENPDQLAVDLSLSAFVMPAEAGEKIGRREKTPLSLLSNPFSIEEELSLPGKTVKKSAAGPSLRLQGVWQGKATSAFINGRVVKVGDSINGYQVRSIQDKKVVLTKKGKSYTLRLK